jgi:hypothetical protein
MNSLYPMGTLTAEDRQELLDRMHDGPKGVQIPDPFEVLDHRMEVMARVGLNPWKGTTEINEEEFLRLTDEEVLDMLGQFARQGERLKSQKV